MKFLSHGDQKYRASTSLHDAAEWDGLRIEHRLIGPGPQQPTRATCTELLHVLAGQAGMRRRAEGQDIQQGPALPGTSWIVPAGTNETLLDFDCTTECLIVFLPIELIDAAALERLGINPSSAELAYAGGLTDPVLLQICAALRGLIGRMPHPTDRLFADGLRTALTAYLVDRYSIGKWRPTTRLPSLDSKRLHRVLNLIEARWAESISLNDLASEACLSPFHFARLFHEATGRSPHRFLVERRIRAAQDMIRAGQTSLVEIALDSGFGSQANFSRVFRKITGASPRQYRDTRPTPAR